VKKNLLSILMFLLLIPSYTTFAKEGVTPSGIPLNDVEKRVDSIMDTYIGRDVAGASIVIVKDGQTILLKGYGLSDVEKSIAVDPKKTIFEAGSVSKLFTWSAVMQLVEQGKIDLNANIEEYLPNNYLNLKFKDKITMVNLMSHTAGFEDRSEELFTTNPQDVIPLEQLLDKSRQPEQVFKPGTVISYSNYGTALAGYIVERVSGQPYNEYVGQHILGVLGMKNSTFEQNFSNIPNISQNKGFGYANLNGKFIATPNLYVNYAPAGSLNTTAEDMAYFMMAQLNNGTNKLFEKNGTLNEMHTQSYTVNSNLPGNAHGFWERFCPPYRVLEHGGNTWGYSSMFSIVLEENFGVCILTNAKDENAGLRTALIRLLIGKSQQNLPVQSLEISNLPKVSGTYRMSRGFYSNFLASLHIISNSDFIVTENAIGGIDLVSSYNSTPLHYIQTKPLFYERVNDNDEQSLMDKAGLDVSRISFVVDSNQKVSKMSFGVISDFIPLTIFNKAFINQILILICFLIFTISAITSLMAFVMRIFESRKGTIKNINSAYKAKAAIAFTGTGVILNIVILFIRFMPTIWQRLDPLKIHLILCWALPVVTIGSSWFIFKEIKKPDINIFKKIHGIILLLAGIIFSILLFKWNYLLI
jgi:CubicO group peptidase (beta-lactamase class C family)